VNSSLLHFNGQVILKGGKFSFLFSSFAIKDTHSAKKVIAFLLYFKALLIVKIFSSELEV